MGVLHLTGRSDNNRNLGTVACAPKVHIFTICLIVEEHIRNISKLGNKIVVHTVVAGCRLHGRACSTHFLCCFTERRDFFWCCCGCSRCFIKTLENFSRGPVHQGFETQVLLFPAGVCL